MMISNICDKKMSFTSEQSAYAILDSSFTNIVFEIENDGSGFDIKGLLFRLIGLVCNSYWDKYLLDSFLDDFLLKKISAVEFALKAYKWLEIIENIIKTYNWNSNIDLTDSFLVYNLLDYDILLFGDQEFSENPNKIFIERFAPISSFLFTKQLMTRNLDILGSDGKIYHYMLKQNGIADFCTESKAILLMNYIEKEFKMDPRLVNSNFCFKRMHSFSYKIDLIEIRESVELFGNSFEQFLFKSHRTSKKLFFEYLLNMELFSPDVLFKGIEKIWNYVPRWEGSEEFDCIINGKFASNEDMESLTIEEAYEESLDAGVLEHSDSATENTRFEDKSDNFGIKIDLLPIIVKENVAPTMELKLKSLQKICKIVDENILAKSLQQFYCTGDSYFLFKKKSLNNFASATGFLHAMSIQQCFPNRIGLGLSTGDLMVADLFPFSLQTKNDYFRMTKNVKYFYKEEGLKGIFVENCNLLGNFLTENDFIKDFVEVLIKMDVDSVMKKSEELKEANVKQLINKSADPENLCMMGALWHPWF